MPFHSEAFTSSNATSGANTFIQTNYLAAGSLLPKLNNGMQVSFELPWLAFVAGVSANLCHIRAQANSMTPFPYFTLDPNNRGTAFETPPRVFDFFRMPIPMLPSEEFDIFTSQNSGGAQTPFVFCNFSDGPMLPIVIPPMSQAMAQNPRTPGRVLTAHATGTTTLTAAGWTSVPLTFDQTLPMGLYNVLGMRSFSATAMWARIAPAMGPKWKPGGIAVQAYESFDAPGQRIIPYFGGFIAPWGIWHTFAQNVPPTVEFFATAADVAEEVWFDLQFVGPNPIQGP